MSKVGKNLNRTAPFDVPCAREKCCANTKPLRVSVYHPPVDSAVFSTIDLESGYHQIAIKESDREKTAFSINHAKFHFKRMPFGLKNAPRIFQRCVNDIWAKLNTLSSLSGGAFQPPKEVLSRHKFRMLKCAYFPPTHTNRWTLCSPKHIIS